MLRRSRFANLVDTQLELFVRDRRDLLDDVAARLEAYNRAGRSDAEELYGDYSDAVAATGEALAEMRDRYADTVDDRDGYVRAFNRGVARRLPEYARELRADA
jgi:hypothetical protein